MVRVNVRRTPLPGSAGTSLTQCPIHLVSALSSPGLLQDFPPTLVLFSLLQDLPDFHGVLDGPACSA